jgi:uncharacterized membrane protein YfcA
MMLLVLAWIGILTISLLKGGHGAPSLIGIRGCSLAYWSILAIAFPFLLAVTAIAGKWLRSEHERRLRLGYKFQPGDVRWTPRATFLYPGLCVGAGIAAGACGLGGGTVKGPLLLELGLLPQTTAATSAFMVLLTSSATTFQFIMLDLLPLDYGLWLALWGFVSCYVGQVFVAYLVRRYKKTSLVVLCIATVLAFSTVLMAIDGVRQVIENARSGRGLGFTSVC